MNEVEHLPLLPDDFVAALIDAGVLADGCFYKSIVITIKPRQVVTVDVELEADTRLLDLAHHLPRLPED